MVGAAAASEGPPGRVRRLESAVAGGSRIADGAGFVYELTDGSVRRMWPVRVEIPPPKAGLRAKALGLGANGGSYALWATEGLGEVRITVGALDDVEPGRRVLVEGSSLGPVERDAQWAVAVGDRGGALVAAGRRAWFLPRDLGRIGPASGTAQSAAVELPGEVRVLAWSAAHFHLIAADSEGGKDNDVHVILSSEDTEVQRAGDLGAGGRVLKAVWPTAQHEGLSIWTGSECWRSERAAAQFHSKRVECGFPKSTAEVVIGAGYLRLVQATGAFTDLVLGPTPTAPVVAPAGGSDDASVDSRPGASKVPGSRRGPAAGGKR